jgi:hypothetical protein
VKKGIVPPNSPMLIPLEGEVVEENGGDGELQKQDALNKDMKHLKKIIVMKLNEIVSMLQIIAILLGIVIVLLGYKN